MQTSNTKSVKLHLKQSKLRKVPPSEKQQMSPWTTKINFDDVKGRIRNKNTITNNSL